MGAIVSTAQNVNVNVRNSGILSKCFIDVKFIDDAQ